MKKIIELLISRGFIIGLSIFVQVGFWVLIFTGLREYRDVLMSAMLLLSMFCVIHIIIKDICPEHKIAWIIFMVMFPLAGGLFYLLFGSHRVSRKTKKLNDEIENNIKDTVSNVKTPDFSTNNKKDSFARQVNYLKEKANAPIFDHTSVTYLKLGEDMLEAMIEELEKAQKFIFVESFIIEEGKMWNAIEEVLIRKAKEGVDVRVLYDDMGCLLTLPSQFPKRLRNHQIDCRIFNKINQVINANFNNRDHRKICVIDGNVGFNGGINLADEYINHKPKHQLKHGHWKDTAIMLKGDGVYGLTLIFLSMWNMQTGKTEDYTSYAPTIREKSDGLIQPFADTPLDGESVGENIYMSILNTAKEYVYITTPYLIITREMITSLTSAAKSGIDVRLILPGIPDKTFVHFLSRSYYESLIKAGVKVYEYIPGFIHAKMFVSDDDTAIVGTINLDYRSLNLHYECGTMIYGASVIEDIKKDYIQTLSQCEEITLEKIKVKNKPNVVRFILLGILRTFSPLM
ncbi:MAG: cardiolipin synthase [Eubacteriales bacterium]